MSKSKTSLQKRLRLTRQLSTPIENKIESRLKLACFNATQKAVFLPKMNVQEYYNTLVKSKNEL